MSHPTPRPGHYQKCERVRAHQLGDHGACRPGTCLVARASRQAADLTDTLDQLATQRAGDHAAMSALSDPRNVDLTREAVDPTVPAPADFPAGYEPRCTVCEVSTEHIPNHPDGRAGGWRHTTDHGEEPHTAHPGGGDRS